MKKILFVMNTMGRAGAERALLALIKNLPKEEYDISLYVLINRGELFDEVPDYVHILTKNRITALSFPLVDDLRSSILFYDAFSSCKRLSAERLLF